MKVIQSLKDISSPFLLTIGNFDGVHRGHQKFLGEMKARAKKQKLAFVVLTFSPHPRLVLSEANDFLLHSCEEKREHLKNLGVDYLFELPFTLKFSQQAPEDFLSCHLSDLPLLKMIYVGHDFCFGAHKSGNHEVMREFCAKKNIFFAVGDEYTIEGHPVSSTMVRKAIKEGNMEFTAFLLSRPYVLKGKIIKGFGRGRQLGFPTANLDYDDKRIIPRKGVFLTKSFYEGKEYDSLTNVGLNPTFDGITKISIETHLLNFNKDIYNEEISVVFLKFLRPETKFSSIDELVRQIKMDVDAAREYFALC